MSDRIRKQLIASGVNNLQKFGYPGVNESNILTDEIYSTFFRRMVEETAESAPTAVKLVCDRLLAEMEEKSDGR